jgi:hypothetical protein
MGGTRLGTYSARPQTLLFGTALPSGLIIIFYMTKNF